MHAQIQNFRGLTAAEINLEKVALVAGQNGAGKTSALLPVACALSGITTPLGLRKTDGGMLVKTGASKALVAVSNGENSVSIEWPKGDRVTKGDRPPAASEVATGLINVAEMTTADRSKFLTDLLKIEPTREDFDKACRAVGLMGDTQKIWDTIERDGWDATQVKSQNKGREQKGAWQQVTKDGSYGSKKAEAWMPTGWDDALASRSLDTLESDVAAAKSELEFSIGKLAVSEDEFARLSELADGMESAREKRDVARQAVTARDDVHKAASTTRNACEPATDAAGLPCPSCGTKLENKAGPGGVGRVLVEAVALSKAELDKRRAAIASADGTLNKAATELSEARTALQSAEASLLAAEKAQAEIESGATTDGTSAAEADAMRETVRRAEISLSAFTTKKEADRIHGAIQRNELLVGVLSESGVRREVLLRKLAEFNTSMSIRCKTAKWSPVTVSDSLTVEYGGRSYSMLSGSEKFRASVTLQIEIAALDGSDAVVIDGADILDRAGRSGLMAAAVAWGKPALIGMTMPSVDDLPDLSARGVGFSYWVEAGNFNGKVGA